MCVCSEGGRSSTSPVGYRVLLSQHLQEGGSLGEAGEYSLLHLQPLSVAKAREGAVCK